MNTNIDFYIKHKFTSKAFIKPWQTLEIQYFRYINIRNLYLIKV